MPHVGHVSEQMGVRRHADTRTLLPCHKPRIHRALEFYTDHVAKCKTGSKSAHDAFLPIGLTLIIPFRNSTKVPLARFIQIGRGEFAEGNYRLMGISISAI